MGSVRSYGDLRVYQLAFAAAMRIYELSKAFPKEERYSLTDQVRKSSRSVCTNLAEGWRKCRCPASFVSKISDADGEAAETCVWLDFALACGFINALDHDELIDTYHCVCGGLADMVDHPEEWCASRATAAR